VSRRGRSWVRAWEPAVGTRAGDAVAVLEWQLRSVGAPLPVLEHRFHPERKWRFDLAWSAQRVAVEVDGGAWVGGRHTSGSGFEADCEKLSVAAANGWRVLRITPNQVRSGAGLSWVLAALAWSPEEEAP